MGARYFHRVEAQTPTIFWINNPTRWEADEAIAEGALGCTCNPSYAQKMVDHPDEGPYALELLDQAIRESEDDDEVAAIFQRKLVKPIVDKFQPLYEASGGKHGYVSIQGDPIREEDPKVILHEAYANREMGSNTCIKIPTTAAGLAAMKELVGANIPLNATEIMGIAQAISMCEMYEAAAQQSGKRPVIFLSHIAGIYDEYLQGVVARERIDISPDVLFQAGLAVARKVYAVCQARGYSAFFVGGGARGLHHFTEMVGGEAVVTINWKGTADKLLEQDPPVVYRLFNPVPEKVTAELKEKLVDFRRGYEEDGLKVEEYEEFGPVMLFRSSFIKSWKRVLGLIKERRAALRVTT